jgi:predicted small lipoprotein YifL
MLVAKVMQILGSGRRMGVALTLMLLTACGQKGPLVLPESTPSANPSAPSRPLPAAAPGAAAKP